jgi:two-component system CheB/CheR fusion protein
MVMLGPDLRIRRITPTAEKMLNLIPSDVGRPLTDLKLSVTVSNIEQMLTEVIDSISTKEAEVQDKEGRWCILRIRPYRTLENKIDGAVLMLIDIDRLKRAHQQVESILQAISEPLLVVDEELRVVMASTSFYETFRTTPQEADHGIFYKVGPCHWNMQELRDRLEEVRLRNRRLDNLEVECRLDEQGSQTFLVSARQLEASSAGKPVILLTMRDISERKRFERDLAQRLGESARAKPERSGDGATGSS